MILTGIKELNEIILSHLSDKDVCNFLRSCKETYRVWMDDSFWERRIKYNFPTERRTWKQRYLSKRDNTPTYWNMFKEYVRIDHMITSHPSELYLKSYNKKKNVIGPKVGDIIHLFKNKDKDVDECLTYIITHMKEEKIVAVLIREYVNSIAFPIESECIIDDINVYSNIFEHYIDTSENNYILFKGERIDLN